MTDHKDLIKRLAWPVNPNAPEAEVTLPAWVLELCAEARDAIEAAREAQDELVLAEATAAAYGAAAGITTYHYNTRNDKCEHPLSRESQEIILSLTPQSARDWLAEREAAAYRKGQENMRERAAGVANDGAIATEDDGVAAWVRDRIRALPIKEKNE